MPEFSDLVRVPVRAHSGVLADLNKCLFDFDQFVGGIVKQIFATLGITLDGEVLNRGIGPALYPMYGPSLFQALLTLAAEQTTLLPWMSGSWLQSAFEECVSRMHHVDWSEHTRQQIRTSLPEVPGARRLMHRWADLLKVQADPNKSGPGIGVCTAWSWNVAGIALKAHFPTGFIRPEFITIVEMFPHQLGTKLDKDVAGPWAVAIERLGANARHVTVLEDSPSSGAGAVLAGVGRVIVCPSKPIEAYESLSALARNRGTLLHFVKDWAAVEPYC